MASGTLGTWFLSVKRVPARVKIDGIARSIWNRVDNY
jgi:hypothetical protein